MSALIATIVIAYTTATMRSASTAQLRRLGAHASPTTISQPAPPPQIMQAEVAPEQTYRVKRGDTLWDISRQKLA